MFLELFDSRTGDFLNLYDFFNAEGKQKLHEKILNKIESLANDGKTPPLNRKVSIAYKLMQKRFCNNF